MMFNCSRWTCALRVPRPTVSRSLVIMLSVFAVALFAGHAAAQQALCLDHIQGDSSTSIQWSEGLWTLNNIPVGGCVTFAGGVSTGPSGPVVADSLICSPAPNGWRWTVTIPGPYTISYVFGSFPPGYRICGDIFSRRGERQLTVKVDVGLDFMEIRGGGSPPLLYSGSYSEFDPELEGFRTIDAHRCGRYTPIYLGACCFPDGSCQFVTAAECQTRNGVWLGPGGVCESNPCPQPTGNCCDHVTGLCSIVTEAACTASGFTWFGTGPCDAQTCPVPVPTGNCCDHTTGLCLIVTEAACTASGFTWFGTEPCDVQTCPVPVPTERASWGQIKSIYR